MFNSRSSPSSCQGFAVLGKPLDSFYSDHVTVVRVNAEQCDQRITSTCVRFHSVSSRALEKLAIG
jgi:hypothetical protein